MSDINAFLDAQESPQPEATPEAPAPEQPAASTPEIPEELRPYVQELREEAKQRRLEHEPFRNAFDGYDEAERDLLLGLVNHLKNDVDGGAKQMRDIAYRLLVDPTSGDDTAFHEGTPWQDKLGAQVAAASDEAVAAAEEAKAEGEAAGLTAEQVAKLVSDKLAEERAKEEARRKEEANANAQQRALAQLHEISREEGIEPGGPEYQMLTYYMVHETNGDPRAAAAKVRERLGTAAPESAPSFPTPVEGGAGAQPEPPTEKPKSVKEARAAMNEWLDSIGA